MAQELKRLLSFMAWVARRDLGVAEWLLGASKNKKNSDLLGGLELE